MRLIWIALGALAAGCQMGIAPSTAAAHPQAATGAQPRPGEQNAPASPPDRTLRPAPVTPQRDDPSAGDTTPEPTDPPSRALVDKARADLAQRLGLGANQVQFVSFRAVVWPNAGLGCPRPGMEYLQVPKDGVLIRLTAQGQTYAYHGGGGREPFLCTNPDALSPAPSKTKPPGDSRI